MLLDIKTYPFPGLREKSLEITHIDDEILGLVAKMVETMENAPGLGLAAPQVGELVRIVIINNPDNDERSYALLNPEITSFEGEQIAEEGCLSIPGVFAKVKRANRITVAAMTSEGDTDIFQAEGRDAQILQHEIDHLDGILFWDRIGKAKRDFVKKKYLKKLKASMDA